MGRENTLIAVEQGKILALKEKSHSKREIGRKIWRDHGVINN